METAAGVQVQASLSPSTSFTDEDILSKTEAEEAVVDEECSDDEFEDATNDNLEAVDLNEAFVDCEAAIKMFFCNDVQGAMNLMRPHAGTSLYHSLGGAIFAFIPAILTFDQNKIMEASAAIKTCIRICNKNRKHRRIVETLGNLMRKPNYSLYTDQEAHAELCYAEALLLQAALTVIEGEDLTSFFKGALKVRTCHITYKHCTNMLRSKRWDSEESRLHFKSGACLGTATFHLMISMLPPKFAKPLEFAGYSGNKYYGLNELLKGYQGPGLRRVLCGLTILGYHLVLQAFVGGRANYKICEEILQEALQMFPESLWFMALKGRFEFLRGNLDEAAKIYKNTSNINQVEFREFRHLCYWELMWISALKLDFRSSSDFADQLMKQSAWSRTTYTYVKATMLMQLEDATQAEQAEVKKLMKEATWYKIRIAGKSLPMEKFVIRRCARYHIQQKKLILPALELLCIWNLLPTLKQNLPILQNMLKSIETCREEILLGSREWMGGHDGDNMALLHFMEGCVLSAMQLPRQAIQHFQQTVALKKEIKDDNYLVPYAVLEMAICYINLEDRAKCKEHLIEARCKYSGYALESRLHFRLQAALQTLIGENNAFNLL